MDAALRRSVMPCPTCGVQIEANAANLCHDCLRSQANLDRDLEPSGPIIRCKKCLRFQTKSKHWTSVDLESAELLSIVLKFISGLNKVEIVDAGWIWTEPHSKRLRIKIHARREILNGVQVCQRVEIGFIIRTIQCEDCTRADTKQTWTALVQVRQHVEHKKTFYLIEQLILAQRMQSQVQDLQLAKDGMDVYFGSKDHAQQFAAFLGTVAPTRLKTSRKLVSEDRKNNTHRVQSTLSVEIAPLCKGDLIILTTRIWGGGMQGLCLVSRITSVIHLLNPQTLHSMEVPAFRFWTQPVWPVMTAKDLVQFEVLDIEEYKPVKANPAARSDMQKWKLVEVVVVKSSDFGVNDLQYRVLTHLGNVLQIGDTVLGYDVGKQTSLLEREDILGLKHDPPDVVLVKKIEPEKGGKKERRRLQRLARRRQAREEGRRKRESEEEGEEKEWREWEAEVGEDEEHVALIEQVRDRLEEDSHSHEVLAEENRA